MPNGFRAPGVPLRFDELLARVRPARAASALLREGRLRAARTRGVGQPWEPGAPVRDLRATAPPGSAFWLDDRAQSLVLADGSAFTLELPGLPWPSGTVALEGGARFTFAVEEADAQRARVAFACEGDAAARVLAWCAQAGAPALGDFAHGGSAAAEGEPVFAREGRLRVSHAAAVALGRGHPWLTRDAESEDEGRFAFGALVDAHDPEGRALGAFRVEGAPQLVARRWADPAERRPQARAASVEERALHALARREALLARGATDALRLVHGEADALPGLYVDRFGPLLRVLVAGRAALPLWARASAVLASRLRERTGAEPSVVLALQLRPQPPGELACVWLAAGPPPPDPLVVREGPLAFRVDAGLDEPTRAHPGLGLFPDQRANRERVARRVHAGGRYLNLFAHTGAFSAAMLAAGAGEVVSVDLSAPYLARLDENLARSGLAGPRHHAVKRDVRRFVRELPPDARFDGVVLDPPTAAAAGRDFWSAHAGLEELVADVLRHLAPGGFLLVTTNERRRRGRLRDAVLAAARRAAVLVTVGAANPSLDFPSLRGFPEGDAFEGVVAERREALASGL